MIQIYILKISRSQHYGEKIKIPKSKDRELSVLEHHGSNLGKRYWGLDRGYGDVI